MKTELSQSVTDPGKTFKQTLPVQKIKEMLHADFTSAVKNYITVYSKLEVVEA